MRLLIAGGGTGGHLFPAIAIAEEFTGRSGDNKVLFVGTKRGIEKRVLPKCGWQVSFVAAEGIKGKSFLGIAKGFFKAAYGILQSMRIIRLFRPDVILGVGGYASVPVVLAGKLMGTRAAIHEQNAFPGLANRVLGRFVKRVFLTYAESERFFSPEKRRLTGNPVREAVINALRRAGDAAGSKDGFTILVFGGSRGARRLNEVAVEAFCGAGDIKKIATIIHQTGGVDFERVKRRYEESGVNAEVYPFIEDMASAYGRADLAVCRAGATTISELMAAGKPSILIPYPFAADDHQRMNAEVAVKSGAARMIQDGDLNSISLAEEVKRLIEDKGLLKEMSERAKSMSVMDAASIICDEIARMAV